MQLNPILQTIALLVISVMLSSCASLPNRGKIDLDSETRERCLSVLRSGMRSSEFWPSIHAAEGLTLGGHGEEVIAYLSPKLPLETDDQQRCGLSRELVRAGDRDKAQVMLDILEGEDDHGHIHAAESLYKVNVIGDGKAMRRAFHEGEDIKLRLMAAAALGRKGNAKAMSFLRESMNSEDTDTYRIAAWILGRIGNRSDIERMRRRLDDATDPVAKAYLEHSMAALGDSAGLEALEANLSSSDPAIRTYAATFAGDARATHVAPRLKKMLNDPHLDARYRAAQSLLFLSR